MERRQWIYPPEIQLPEDASIGFATGTRTALLSSPAKLQQINDLQVKRQLAAACSPKLNKSRAQ